ncbi:MAG: PilZ domain-containing protein [Cyanobium sp.]
MSLDPDIRAQLPRGSTRTTLSFDSPGRLILPEQQTVFVTLHDISRSGCCVSRKGLLEAHPGDRVTIEMWREKIETKESFKAVICWVRHHERSTRVGLRFLDTSARTLRAVDAYLRSSARPGA